MTFKDLSIPGMDAGRLRKTLTDLERLTNQRIYTASEVDRLLKEQEARLLAQIQALNQQAPLYKIPDWVYPCDPGWPGTFATELTNASWEGGARSDEGFTEINMPSVFGIPSNCRAVLCRIIARDSVSLTTTGLYFSLSNYAGGGVLSVRPSGIANDYYIENTGVVPCSENGNIYYSINASGAGTLDAYLRVCGFLPR